MYKVKKALFFNILTPMHVGGSYELSVIDQPIQRESHTGFPKVESSSLKGSLRHAFMKKEIEKAEIDQIFGTEEADMETGFASSVAFSDARLLFFPVRSAKGVFAYVTSPMVLRRFFNDMELVGRGLNQKEKLMDCSEQAIVPSESKIVFEQENKGQVLLEEYVFDVNADQTIKKAFKKFLEDVTTYIPLEAEAKEFFQEHAIIVSDDAFSDFVKMSTEIITRIRIKTDTGIVDEGALFNEEYLPSDTVMYSLLFISDGFHAKADKQETKKDADFIATKLINHLPDVFQVGGNATLGKGFVQCNVVPEEESK